MPGRHLAEYSYQCFYDNIKSLHLPFEECIQAASSFSVCNGILFTKQQCNKSIVQIQCAKKCVKGTTLGRQENFVSYIFHN
jgi:hypothetical protein